MPHFVIEHSDCMIVQSRIDELMHRVLKCGAGCGFIEREDIKVRLLPCQKVLFGDGRVSFIHVTVRLLAGRADKQKESLAIELRSTLAEGFPETQSISIDIVDMNPASYKKRLVN